ncbi:Permease of the drug/metabolite transporter (DMT) superfamily [Labilithrix luteola]|uniref:Permease of the drug/metabolite transporter (DMT) superfamily n=1 Tax=Labilithrix luteola TaxID=1391654 RepID=A0A0K1Q4F4_9BACT|nr:drug/metabolite exporter YedA [Labilithrix luteola]AKV00618.1 Permease of the drug/metabolite transporter (DMT) superfamily [Labilithrix luteola]
MRAAASDTPSSSSEGPTGSGAVQKASPEASRQSLIVAGALLAVYVVWGSTYYAMRVALEDLPPFLMAGPRFLFAGGALMLWQRFRGAPFPTARQWLAATAVGFLLLVCGNGFVAIAERSVDTGVAATVVATMPLWAAAVGLFWGEKPSAREFVGLVAGFAGVAILNRGGNLSFSSTDAIALVIAPITWAFGSVWSRRLPMPAGTMGPAAQMVSGGVMMIGIALVRGEHPHGPLSVSGILALAYLVTFGSMLGFSAYGYLLRTTRPSIATSYAYVNPLVALGIGAVLAGERFTMTKLAACLLTIVGVLVVSYRKSARR